MSQPTDSDVQETLTEALARAGIVVTAEGKARARARMAKAVEGWTPERSAAARAKLRLPERTA